MGATPDGKKMGVEEKKENVDPTIWRVRWKIPSLMKFSI
jgi:hypothetical protein